MKKLLSIFAAAVLVSSSVGCAGGKKVNIGVIEQAECTELSDAYSGFVEGLAEAGYNDGDNIKLDFYDGQNDSERISDAVKKVVASDKDMIFALSESVVKQVSEQTDTIPIIGTAVTDYEASELNAANITGTSDKIPVEEQIALLKQIAPKAKKLAIVYNSNDKNAVNQANRAAVKGKDLGMNYSFKPITYEGDADQVMNNIIGAFDAVYIPSDPIVYNCLDVIGEYCDKAKMPVIVGDEGMLEKYGLATVAVDYKELGKKSAQMAVKIIEGTSPSDIPIEYNTNYKLIVNDARKDAIGLITDVKSGSFAPIAAESSTSTTSETTTVESAQ
jgi:putative ABC transport system substrate-binding protein